jgi:MoaA/NifB/PqqE/SkfB family radical SAM enzyme
MKHPQFHPVTGFSRLLFALRMRLTVFFQFMRTIFTGERTISEFIALLKRLQSFSLRHDTSKFIRFGQGVRMGLYIPTFLGKPFLRAAENMCGSDERIKLVSAVMSITTECPFRCEYCYQRHDTGALLSLEKLLGAVRTVQEAGVAIFVLEGGEPFSAFDRLQAVCDSIDGRSEIWVNTTGAGVTRERLCALCERGLTALKISVHHHTPEGHNRFLGSPEGWISMNNAVSLCRELSIPFTFNCRIMPSQYYDGSLEALLSFAREQGACYVQCLTPRSAGGNMGRESISLGADELQKLGEVIRRFNRDRKYRVYPAIFSDEYDERVIFGCTAGSGRLYLNAHGKVQPCQHINVSFGDVSEEPMAAIITRMGDFFKKPGRCTACTKVAASVAKRFTDGMALPLPFSVVQKDWEMMTWGDFKEPERNTGSEG